MADKKILELDNLTSIDGTGDFLVIVDGSAGSTKKTSVDTLIGDKISAVELNSNNPRTSGYTADINTIGQAIDGTRWIKTDSPDTSWEQIFISDSGTFSANIELAEVSGIIPTANTIGSNDGELSVGDGETLGGVKMATQANDIIMGSGDLLPAEASGQTFTGFNEDWKAVTQTNGLTQLHLKSSAASKFYTVPWTPYPTTVGNPSFSMAFSSIKGLHLPKSVTKVESFGFAYCSSFTTLNLPPSISLIDTSAFANDPITGAITLPKNCIVKSYGFQNGSITSLDTNGAAQIHGGSFEGNSITSASLKEGLVFMGSSCLNNNSITGDIRLPDTLQNTPYAQAIQGLVFSNNTGINDIYINLESSKVDPNAFSNCGTGALFIGPDYSGTYSGVGTAHGSKTIAEWTNYPNFPN
jgi:hypothetical protein